MRTRLVITSLLMTLRCMSFCVTELGSLVEPMVWAYRSDLTGYFPPGKVFGVVVSFINFGFIFIFFFKIVRLDFINLSFFKHLKE